VQNHFNAYGRESFSFEILDVMDDLSEEALRRAEQAYLDRFFREPTCMNLNPRADRPPRPTREESIEAGRKGAAALNSVKNADGKSAAATKGGRKRASVMHTVKNADGKSELAVKSGRRRAAMTNSVRTPDGKSAAAVKGGTATQAKLSPEQRRASCARARAARVSVRKTSR
jgi:hypothetical protein